MSGGLPDFVIVGAPKSGTTSLARWLGDHPEVHMAPGKEVLFFDQRYDRGIGWYREQFSPAPGERLLGEGSPSYLFDPDAPDRMHAHVPQARLIAMLREPVDRAYSHYWHWRTRLGETREWEEAVEEELAAGRPTTSANWDPTRPHGYHYLARGRYRFQLERYAQRFGRDRLHVILFEELEADPERAFRDTCAFLGIDPDPVPASVGAVFNAYRTYHPLWLWGIFVRIQIGRFMPKRWAAALHDRMVRFEDPYPPMDPALRERLRTYMAPDNAETAQWLGRALPESWS